MDDMERKAVYDAALRLVQSDMMRLYGHWASMGEVLTEGEQEEINKELGRLQTTAGRAAIVAKEVVAAISTRSWLSSANDIANANGFTLVDTDALEDDDDEGEEESSSE